MVSPELSWLKNMRAMDYLLKICVVNLKHIKKGRGKQVYFSAGAEGRGAPGQLGILLFVFGW